MKIWTISNQKGGVGKTTTVVTLAGLLSTQGKRVLCVDLEPQGSMTSYFCLNPDTIQKSVYNLFKDSSEQLALDSASYIQNTSEVEKINDEGKLIGSVEVAKIKAERIELEKLKTKRVEVDRNNAKNEIFYQNATIWAGRKFKAIVGVVNNVKLAIPVSLCA